MKKTQLKQVAVNDNQIKYTLANGGVFVKLSLVFMGISNIRYGQLIKGLGFLFLELAFICYMISTGASSLLNLITLGTAEQSMVKDEATGMFVVMQGDNSMRLLLGGVAALLIIVIFVFAWVSSIKSGLKVTNLYKNNKRVPTIIDDIKSLFDINIHKLLLFIPIAGLIVLTILPLVYMILMAFTNYDSNHQPPGKLFNWIGLDNFRILLTSSDTLAQTFWPVLQWTIIWAIIATISCYFGGILLAILISSKGIRFKKMWRTIFVLSMAIPGFIGLLLLRQMLTSNGIVNILLQNMGFITSPLPFWTNATWAKVTILIANFWIGIPVTMLLTSGILVNIPADLYESARIDGATPAKIFIKITFPYIFFITTPTLITSFIGNINNFNVIYFLTAGGPLNLHYFQGAGSTDILVSWLYKLTMENRAFSYASTIGIVVFLISAIFSLITFRRSGAFKNEEGFQL